MGASGIEFAIERFTTFGDLLRFLRRRAGLTQRELSIAVGYSEAQISRLEQNERVPDRRPSCCWSGRLVAERASNSRPACGGGPGGWRRLRLLSTTPMGSSLAAKNDGDTRRQSACLPNAAASGVSASGSGSRRWCGRD
jgi:hypothetical protein